MDKEQFEEYINDGYIVRTNVGMDDIASWNEAIEYFMGYKSRIENAEDEGERNELVDTYKIVIYEDENDDSGFDELTYDDVDLTEVN